MSHASIHQKYAGAMRRQQGAVLVELGMLILLMLMVGAILVQFGRAIWCYQAAHKAAHEVSRYLARVPMSERASPTRSIEMRRTAVAIVNAVMADARVGQNTVALVTCTPAPLCSGTTVPAMVGVNLTTGVLDTSWFTMFEDPELPSSYGYIEFRIRALVPYVGA